MKLCCLKFVGVPDLYQFKEQSIFPVGIRMLKINIRLFLPVDVRSFTLGKSVIQDFLLLFILAQLLWQQ